MKAGSRSEQAAVQPCSQSSQSGQATEQPCSRSSRCRNNRWPAAATKDLGERTQTAQLGEKTLGEITLGEIK